MKTIPWRDATVPEGHKHRVTTPEKPRKIPQNPLERPRRALGETPQSPRRDPAEPSERQISSESLVEGCAPRMVTLWNFRNRKPLEKQGVEHVTRC